MELTPTMILSSRRGGSSATVLITALIVIGLAGCGGMPSDDPVENGQWLAKRYCVTCHGAEDTSFGPSLRDLAGTEVTLADGATRLRDRAYFEQAITDPWSEVVEGYGRTMLKNSYAAEEVHALLEWLEAGAPGP